MGDEIWAMLIEKAWAKLHGSYCAIRKGQSILAMPHFTGAAARQFNHNTVSNADHFWAMIKDAVEKKFVVTSSTLGDGEAAHGDGLLGGHSYSLMSFIEAKIANKNQKVIKLRNPWGKDVTGDENLPG